MFNFLDELRDTVTGFEGTVVAIVDYASRGTQYGLQPKCKDNLIPDVQAIDEAQLELVKAAGEKRTPFAESTFNNGDKVRDKVTGFKGTITARTEYLNGCIHYSVTPRVHERKIIRTERFAQADLEILQANPKPAADTKTGGPRTVLTREKFPGL